MLHGTAGLSYTGVYYAAALNRAGIATLEVDQWGGRGLPGGASSRPKGLGDMLPDIAGAYGLLVQRSDIDTQRIGLMGSSMGGIETLLMMTRGHSDATLGKDVHVKAAVALYPICWLYNRVPGADFVDLVDAPVRILVGSEDDYDGGGVRARRCFAISHRATPRTCRCASFRTRLISLTASLAPSSTTTQPPIGAKAESFMSGPIPKRASKRATISRNSLPPPCANNDAEVRSGYSHP